MMRAPRIAVPPGYAKAAQAGISAEDAARYEAAIEAKDAALDACIEAMEGYLDCNEADCAMCQPFRDAKIAARKARQL